MAITFTPAAPRAVIDAVAVTVDSAPQNTNTGYSGTVPSQSPGSPTQYPASPEVRYYLRFVKGGVELGRSYVFSTDENGGHVFANYAFPSAGSWTVTLCNAATDAVVQTQAVTVT